MGSDKGFTLIEIVAVLLLLGVVSAVLVAGGLKSDAGERTATEVLKSHLRYAQSRSMNGDVSWGVQFGGGTYSLVRDVGGVPQTVAFPGENRLNLPIPSTAAGSVSFDTWGKPSGLSSITLGGQVITITPDTGFIP